MTFILIVLFFLKNVHNKKLYCRYKKCNHFVYTKHNLKFHVALHRGFEPNNNVEHICEHCGLVDEENAIKRHQKIHMPKLHCPICRQPFRILNSLEKHIKSEHNDLFKKTIGGIRNRGRKNSIF